MKDISSETATSHMLGRCGALKRTILKTKSLSIIFLAFLYFGNAFCQDDRIDILAKSLYKDCPLYSNGQENVCQTLKLNALKKRLANAEEYLQKSLTTAIITDSSEIFYNEQKEILATLEKERKELTDESQNLIQKLEENYLTLSLLRIHKSREYFDHLIKLYFEEDSLEPSCSDGQNPYQDGCVLSESILYYQIWLYDLLIDRFESYQSTYTLSKATAMNNWIVDLVSQPFYGDLNHEKEVMNYVTKWAPLVIQGNHLTSYSSLEDFLAQSHLARSTTVWKWELKFANHAFFLLLEEHLLKAKELNPNQKVETNIDYYLYLAYHNYSMYLKERIDNGENQQGLENIQKAFKKYSSESEIFREKSMPEEENNE